jgi:hypothetical protein
MRVVRACFICDPVCIYWTERTILPGVAGPDRRKSLKPQMDADEHG